MNIFMPELTIEDSVKALDDKRLIKQILECYQIISINNKALIGEKVGYANHAVVRYYRDNLAFVVAYGAEACFEHRRRFNKSHKYFNFFLKWYVSLPTFPTCYRITYIDRHENIEAHAIYNINDTQILKGVNILFRNKLSNKWRHAKYKPTWTNRKAPDWYNPQLQFDLGELNYGASY